MSPRPRIVPSMAFVFGTALAVLQPATAAAQQPNVDFSVSGTSTVRSWTCTAKGVLKVTPGTGAPPLPGMAGGVQDATLTVPVKDFKCPNDEMTQHLMEAMKPEQHAEITYRLERYVVNGGQAEATGAVTINGVTAPLSLPLTVVSSRRRTAGGGEHPHRHDEVQRRSAGRHDGDAEGGAADPHRIQGRRRPVTVPDATASPAAASPSRRASAGVPGAVPLVRRHRPESRAALLRKCCGGAPS